MKLKPKLDKGPNTLYNSGGEIPPYSFEIIDVMNWKYNEEGLLSEIQDYIASTYHQHYSAGDNKIQTLDLIESFGDAEPFCRSNAIKYLSRYDKKGTARRDIMKAIHYCLLLLYFSDKSTQTEPYHH